MTKKLMVQAGEGCLTGMKANDFSCESALNTFT